MEEGGSGSPANSQSEQEEGPDKNSFHKLKVTNQLLRLRQVAISPHLLLSKKKSQYQDIHPITGSGKLQVLHRLVWKFLQAGRNVLVFSGFQRGVDVACRTLELLGGRE